ncbi:MAG: YbaB/EbfC family nucleoid-associated protein [Bacillota bacterium]|nr:YbaB/EbfC family nucleoid-associated protein [Bacillota bacterium]
MSFNVNRLLKQLEKVQGDVARAQEELRNRRIEASAGGGAVTAVVDGTGVLQSVRIQREVLGESPGSDDLEMLQDLIVAAVGEAQRQAREAAAQEMAKATGGLGGGLPGLPGLPDLGGLL